MRDLNPVFLTAMQEPRINLAFFVQFDFYESTLRFWTGIGDKTFLGETWLGVGDLGRIESRSQSRELVSHGFRLSLSGVSAAVISQLLQTRGKGRGRPFSIYLALMDDDFDEVLSDSSDEAYYHLSSGFIDESRVLDSADIAEIEINVEDELVRLFRPNEVRYTNQDQQRIFPGDVFFEFVERLANKTISWGRASPPADTGNQAAAPVRNGLRASSQLR